MIHHLIEAKKKAILAAFKSKGTGRARNFRVGACIFNHKIIIAKENTYKTHPFALKYSPYPYLHAETNCLVSAGLDNCKGCDIIIVRLKRDKSLSMALPCLSCLRSLRYVGIRNIYYSDWNGNIQKLGK